MATINPQQPTAANGARPSPPTGPKPASPARPATSGRMSLKNRIVGVQQAPIRVVLYGVEGVGKSTFGAGAPKPIFLGEDGSAQLSVDRFQTPLTWDDVLAAVRALRDEEHDRQTVVLDTLDWLEPLNWTHTCKAGGKKNLEDFGFGKGAKFALENWRILLRDLDELRRARGMRVVLLAHCQVKTFKNPDHEVGDYDRYELKLDKLAAGLVKEWSDVVLLANIETHAHKDENDGRVRGVSRGVRIVHTERRPAWDAKNRFSLPPTMPLSWDGFAEAVEACVVDRATLLTEIDGLVARADVETQTKARGWLATAADRADRSLVEFADKLRSKLALENRPQAPTVDAPATENDAA